jgi:hypothetical protein
MPAPRLRIDRAGSFPRLLLHGRPCATQPYLRSWEKYPGREATSFADLCRDYRQQYALGCRLFSFQATCGSDFYIPEVEVWRGPDSWDWSSFEAFLGFFERECPEAALVPLVYVGAPMWWEGAHPDELLRFADGSCEAEFSAASGSPRRRCASLASAAWMTAMEDGLRRLVGRFGARIDGWFLGSGITYEWGLLGSFGWIDYSAPMQRWWKAWRERRGLPPAPLPSPEERMAGIGDWRSPARHGAAADLQRCLSDLVADRIVRCARTVKEASDGSPVLVYYGYTLTAREGTGFVGRYGAGGFQGGHHALRTVLDCPDIDAITSPWSYADRRLGGGDLSAHYPWDSVRLAGKVSWLQDDNRTCRGFPAQGIDTGFEPDLAGCVLQMRRATARRLVGADEVYRMDLLGGTWDDPVLVEAIRSLDAAAAAVEDLRAPAAAEVLVVVDEDAVADLALSSPLHLQNVYRQMPQFARMGCPFHVVLASDAERLATAPYRLLILALCPRRDPRLERITARFRAAGAAVLALPGTGLVGADGPDPAGAATIAGIPLACLEERTVLRADSGDGGWGLGRPLSHQLLPLAGEALAALVARPEAALALVRRGASFDAWAAVAPLPGILLATLARRAGCHMVHDGGQLTWSTPHLLAIHADHDGEQVLRPRQPSDNVRAVLMPEAWCRDPDGAIRCRMKTGETAVFAVTEQ